MKNCVRCARMGGDFLDDNGMTDRADFLIVRKEFKEEMKRKWSLFHQDTRTKVKRPAEEPAGAGEPPEQPKKVPKATRNNDGTEGEQPEPNKKRKRGKKDTNDEPTNNEEDPPNQKTDLEVSVGKALALKKRQEHSFENCEQPKTTISFLRRARLSHSFVPHSSDW